MAFFVLVFSLAEFEPTGFSSHVESVPGSTIVPGCRDERFDNFPSDGVCKNISTALALFVTKSQQVTHRYLHQVCQDMNHRQSSKDPGLSKFTTTYCDTECTLLVTMPVHRLCSAFTVLP